jgi:hypothetical protein
MRKRRGASRIRQSATSIAGLLVILFVIGGGLTAR